MAGGASLLGDLRKAFRDAARAAIADETVLVCLGHPGKAQPDDIVSVGDITLDAEYGAMSNRRQREVLIVQEGIVSSFVRGGRDAEEKASDRACLLLMTVEEYLRGDGTDTGNGRTTLGGLVRECFLTHAGPAGGFDSAVSNVKGRAVEIPFAFTAKARIY
jgi:hypothetical protein